MTGDPWRDPAALHEYLRDAARQIADHEVACYLLGEPGAHFEQEEWDLRAAAIAKDLAGYLLGDHAGPPA
jgi:hypothetical protein